MKKLAEDGYKVGLPRWAMREGFRCRVINYRDVLDLLTEEERWRMIKQLSEKNVGTVFNRLRCPTD